MSDNPLSVIWHEGVLSLEKRSRYGIATLLNETFDNCGFPVVHGSTMADMPAGADEAVIVIHGEHELNKVDQILQDINSLKQSIVVIIGDDAAMMRSQTFVSPNRKIWQQMAIPGRHNFAARHLICGYPHDAQMHLNHFDASSVNRPLDWFFSGQVTHKRRWDCATALRGMKGGFLRETPGFWQGLDRAEYYRKMSEAKIIPCPSGPVTPDTIRLAEALEAGCVPIADGTCPRVGYPADGYWQYVLGCTPPFPIIYNWNDLPQVMRQQLEQWPRNRDTCVRWWKEYKQKMYGWLAEDLNALRRAQ